MINKFKDLSIRNKLSAIVLITSGLLITLMATFFVIDKSRSYRRNMIENISMLAEVIGTNTTAALAFDDPETAKEILSALKAEPDVIMACIYTADGSTFDIYQQPVSNPSASPGGSLPTERIETFIQTFADKPNYLAVGNSLLDISRPIRLNAKTIGHVAIRADLSRLKSRLNWFIILTGIASVFLFLVAHFICARLHRVITEPISNMLDTMKRVSSEKDFSRRVAKKTDDELGLLINGFNEMLDRIQRRDLALENHRERLEEKVLLRTKELQRSNVKLKKEIEERTQVQEELARAQKMEAIGTLAAGVAHDLNNILSGITSYPEYLLANTPEDSPIRKPLLTIQTSGNKAAAIVKDLLVLSHRSVALVDQVVISKLVDDYLASPELAHMISFHPKVEIQKYYAPNLPLISGSEVHLQKTIMNLITNAAEAMPDGGNIHINVDTIHLEAPISGYDSVEKGEYIRLSVIDSGVGIADDELSRIFEPFFTKKKLGRSGTGLGMAIVWGTIKDHKGYIEVKSSVHRGTAFTLYFPASKRPVKSMGQITKEISSGNGESILIVDDSKVQREIASEILTSLGYNVNCVHSGEAAIEYLTTRKVDLVFLDMIMDPGINGFETYKRIVEMHPGQRAIIASGYSESEHVKQTQALGAGQYVRKPYTIQKISAAIRNELDQ